MRIPYLDSRAGNGRRWTDLLRSKQALVDDICELIDRCDDLDRRNLIELKMVIEKKIAANTYPSQG